MKRDNIEDSQIGAEVYDSFFDKIVTRTQTSVRVIRTEPFNYGFMVPRIDSYFIERTSGSFISPSDSPDIHIVSEAELRLQHQRDLLDRVFDNKEIQA